MAQAVSLQRRIGAAMLLMGLLALFFMVALPKGPAGAVDDVGNTNSLTEANADICSGVESGGPHAGVALATDVVGTEVAIGQVVTVTLTWVTGDWSSIDKLGDCVFPNGLAGSPDLSLSDGEKPADANDGIFIGKFTVPATATELCIAGRVSGTPLNGESTKKTTRLCFTVVPATTTTTTAPTTTTTAPTTTTTAPTTTTTAPTTTTTAPTTTTTAPTTTTTAPTTTTTAPTTTTTRGGGGGGGGGDTTTTTTIQTAPEVTTTTTIAAVLPNVVQQAVTTTTAEVLAVAAVRGELPRTGASHMNGLLALAAITLIVGGLMLLLTPAPNSGTQRQAA